MPDLSSSQRRAADALAKNLEEVFGPRLQALVAYRGSQGDGAVHSCAIVDGLSFRDLTRCLPFTDRWRQRGVAVPLMLSQDELQRTLDIFPLEYAAIAAEHVVIRGRDPFAGLTLPAADLRRAIEAQAKSHLIHLREAYLESHGDSLRIAQVIAASAGPFRALLHNIARLHDGAAAAITDESLAAMAGSRMQMPAAVVRDVLAASSAGPSSVTDPGHLLSLYVEAAEAMWEYVDRLPATQ
jgi:hypothetical protein